MTQVITNSPTLPLLYLRLSSFSNPSVASPTSQFILQPFFRSFSNLSVALLTSQLIPQPFGCFTYVTAHSPTIPSLYLRHSSFSNPSVALSTPQLILQPFRCFTYVTAHSPTLPLLHLRHSSFSNPSFASPTSQALHLIHLASSPCRLSCLTAIVYILWEFGSGTGSIQPREDNCCCCWLFNDGHVLQLWPENVTVRRRIIYG